MRTIRNDFQIGLGSLVEFNELNRSYHQAEKVIKVVSKSLLEVYMITWILIFRLIDIEDSYQDVAKYVDDYLGPLLYSERKQGRINRDFIFILIMVVMSRIHLKDVHAS